MNFKKYTPKKLIDFLCQQLCEKLNFPTSYQYEYKDNLSKNENKKNKEENFVINTIKLYGNYRTSQENITSIDDFTYGFKSLILDLKYMMKINKITEAQYNDTLNYIYDSQFKHYEDKAFKNFSYQNIHCKDMIFLLLEYVNKSPIYKAKYSFKSTDIRKGLFSRLELISFNKYQDYKLNKDNFKTLFIDGFENFKIEIKQLVEMIIINKEVEYRTNLINQIYFAMEHLLSNLIKEYNIEDGKSLRNKQKLLSVVLRHFNIEDKLDLKIVTEEILKRCPESSNEFRKLLLQETSLNKGMVEMFLKLINARNSLHDNGISNKDEIALTIGKINFAEVKKGEHNLSMGMPQVIMIILIAIYIFEQIIDKSFQSKDYIEDKWLVL